MPERKRLKDGTLVVRARVYDRRPEAKPKRPVLGTYPDTTKGWKAAERAEGAWYSANRPDAQVTVATLREQYLADHATRWDVLSTQRADERTRAFCEAHADEAAEAVKPEACRLWLATHKGDRQALRAMWAWANSCDMLVTNPWDRIGAHAVSKRKRTETIAQGRGALTEPELASLAAHGGAMVAPWMGELVLFTGYTGLRQGELFAARPDWVEGDLLHVRQQYRSRVPASAPEAERWTLPKYEKTRELALLDEAREALAGANGDEFLWTCPRDGSHFTAGSFAYYWSGVTASWSAGTDAPVWLRERYRMARANRNGGGKGQTGALTFHELRHTFATILLETPGITSEQVALQLGDTVDQVHDTYGHPRSRVAAEHVLRARRTLAPVTELDAVRARRAS